MKSSGLPAVGAIANVVGQTGWSAVGQLLTLMLGFYITCAIFVFGILVSTCFVLAARAMRPCTWTAP